ncbi:uncharacterized protein [Littorina saxatilis]|uniref:Uncharacterized protein n=1 Tax=Littorina saxatilis TaxID=31220 RepID=A0AAN9ASG9_9CAEN
MSSLTLLTATVVVLGLWCWVPIDAFNPRMASCNRTTMPVVTNLSLADWAGRWYQSHISTNGLTTVQYDAVASDVQITVPLAQDRRGQVDQDFIVGRNTFINHATGNCSYSGWLDEVIDGKMSGAYQTQIYPWPVYGYYIYWYDSYVLATDYTSTSVILTEKNVNGYTDITFADIRVFVRNATLAPDAAVVDAALNGFCQGAFLDLSSNFYEQIPTDSDLPCFAPPAK